MRLSPNENRSLFAFALCRALPVIAAACCIQRARKGQRSHAAAGPLRRLEAESELLSCSANPIVQAEEFHAADAGSGRQGRCQMNGVKGADRLPGKRASRSINDVGAQSQHVPMCRCRVQVGAAISRRCLIDLPERQRHDGDRGERAIAPGGSEGADFLSVFARWVGRVPDLVRIPPIVISPSTPS